jgi:hypothetical protein
VTAALGALLARAAAAPAGARAVFLASGVYVVSDTVVVPAGVTLFGLHCWDVVLRLADGARGFGDPAAPRAVLSVPRSAGAGAGPQPLLRVGGLNVQTARAFGPQPPPVPAGWANPNPGAISILWEEGGALPGGGPAHGLVDVFIHPPSWSDNVREGAGASTEVSLWVRGAGARGVFADVWSCNAYASSGFRVTDGGRGSRTSSAPSTTTRPTSCSSAWRRGIFSRCKPSTATTARRRTCPSHLA